MSKLFFDAMEKSFKDLSGALYSTLKPNEHLTLSCQGEQSQFTRFNQSKVRQSGTVQDAFVRATFICNGRVVHAGFQFCENNSENLAKAKTEIETARSMAAALPEDPFAVVPQNLGSSSEIHAGYVPSVEDLLPKMLGALAPYDAAGYLAGGPAFRGMSNSAGQHHWFGTTNFFVDYSLYTQKEKSVKLCYSEQKWDDAKFSKQIASANELLKHLEKPARKIPRGKYRTYFAPAAVCDLVGMLSWNGVSEGALQRGESCVLRIRDTAQKLSEKFSFGENFDLGTVPRFNGFGEVSANKLPIFEKGVLKNVLTSTRSAKQYGAKSNAAATSETMRSAEMATGTLAHKDILKELDTGLFLSNVHYLNWSDLVGGRITGMTRYACFWVEKGEIVSPIEDLRFDETLTHFLGDGLRAVTDFADFNPETGTYGERSLGGTLCPGILVDDFTFTL